MKRLIYLIPVIALSLIACGGGGEGASSGEDNAAEGASTMEGVNTDLSEYGMDYTIVLPENKSVLTDVVATDWGGIEIRQGESFMLSIAYGEGDIDLLKFDLEEDLVYKSEILEESENHILYKREIEGSGMDPEFHFLYVLSEDGGDAIEIQNLKETSFKEEAIRKMLESAKSLSAKGGA